LPRILHPQAVPATELRVASPLASFSASGGQARVAPRFTPSVTPPDASPRVAPGFCIFRPCRRWIFELPRISHPSAHPALMPGVSPAASRFRLRLPIHSSGSPQIPASSGCAGDRSTSHPAVRILRRIWKCEAEGQPEASAPEVLKDASREETYGFVAGTAGRCRNLGRPRGMHRQAQLESVAAGETPG
jgi:hypothetical protein